MLLHSTIPCDSLFPAPRTRLQLATALTSPPASPPMMSAQPSSIANILTTCQSLQSLIFSNAPSSQPSASSLPTPPLAHTPPPLKLRLRNRNVSGVENSGGLAGALPVTTPRKRVTKRAPPRGVNKRRRLVDDDMGRGDDCDNEDHDGADDDGDNYGDDDNCVGETNNESRDAAVVAERPAIPTACHDGDRPSTPTAPHTPKRARIAPSEMPLGLGQSDYHDLALRQGGVGDRQPGTDIEVDCDGEAWSAEDDRILVELVVAKLKLSKEEWQDCARSLGKRDKANVGRRWKTLMGAGDIGLRTRSGGRRAKLHGTWR